MQLTALFLHSTGFDALPNCWSKLTNLQSLYLSCPGELGAPAGLAPLGAWRQLTQLVISKYGLSFSGDRFFVHGLEENLVHLSLQQTLAFDKTMDLQLPQGSWQRHLTSLTCDLEHLLPDAYAAAGEDAHAAVHEATAVLQHATALRVLVIAHWQLEDHPLSVVQLVALLRTLSGLPALEEVLATRWPAAVADNLVQAHLALGCPLPLKGYQCDGTTD